MCELMRVEEWKLLLRTWWLLVTLPCANPSAPSAEHAAGPTEGKAAQRLPLAAGGRGHGRRYSLWYWSSGTTAAALCCFFPPPSWLSSPCFPSNYKIIKEPHSGSVQSSQGFSPNSQLAIFLFQLNFLLSSDITPWLRWNTTFWTIFMDNVEMQIQLKVY